MMSNQFVIHVIDQEFVSIEDFETNQWWNNDGGNIQIDVNIFYGGRSWVHKPCFTLGVLDVVIKSERELRCKKLGVYVEVLTDFIQNRFSDNTSWFSAVDVKIRGESRCRLRSLLVNVFVVAVDDFFFSCWCRVIYGVITMVRGKF